MTNAVDKKVLNSLSKKKVGETFISFLDSVATASSRASHYESKREQIEATEKIHEELFGIDRSIYGLTLLLPGVTDYSMQTGLKKFLTKPVKTGTLLTEEQERMLIEKLVSNIENQRVLKTFVELRKNRVNNSRTRKLILKTILNNDSFEYWCVKYRSKVAQCLQHAWGKKIASVICSILKKKSIDARELGILKKNVDKYIDPATDADVVYSCIKFIFGEEDSLKGTLLKAYVSSKKDLEKGKKLPREVLEGIRSTYHPSIPKEKVLELTAKTMTTRQKKQVQKKAQEAGIKVEFDPKKYGSVELYIYAYEMGMTDEIKEALREKSVKSASVLPFNFKKVGILVDTSKSMFGNKTQKLKPMATGLALRDVLQNVAKESVTVYTGEQQIGDYDLVEPKNESCLVDGLLNLLNDDSLDAIFVISDGYENAPAGRFDEVMTIAKKIGVNTPVYQFSPVFSASTGGVKALSEKVATLPTSKPEAMGLAMVKSMMIEDTKNGIKGLLNIGLKMLEQ